MNSQKGRRRQSNSLMRTGTRPQTERNYEYDQGDLKHRHIYDYDFDNREYGAVNLEGEYKYDDTGKKYLYHNDFEDLQRYGRSGSYGGNFYRMRNQYEGPLISESSYRNYLSGRDLDYDFDHERDERLKEEHEKKSRRNGASHGETRITPARRRRMDGTSTSSRVRRRKAAIDKEKKDRNVQRSEKKYFPTYSNRKLKRSPRGSADTRRGHNNLTAQSTRAYNHGYRY